MHKPVLPGDFVVLFDGSALTYRAFHAGGDLTRPSDGFPVGGIYRLTEMLWYYLMAERRDFDTPTHAVALFDAAGPTFRHRMFEEYKANRGARPEAFNMQRLPMRRVVEAYGIPAIEHDGVEADDLIASYTVKARQHDAEVLIVTPDKDMLQLVGPGVKVFSRIASKNVLFDSDGVRARHGVYPYLFGDFLAMTGDTIDGVKGIDGVGPKKAAALLDRFGSLESCLERAQEVAQPGLRRSLLDGADTARLARRLIQLKSDCDLETPLDELGYPQPDITALLALCEEFEFPSFTEKFTPLRGHTTDDDETAAAV